jgi:hypothetical protein
MNRNAVSGYFNNTLGIASVDTRNALLDQGLDDFDHFLGFSEEDIEQICANVRKPGGTIANPDAGEDGQPARIPNPGHPIGYLHEKRLKQLCYERNQLVRVQRNFVANSTTIVRLNETWRLREEEKQRDDIAFTPDHPEKCAKVEDVKKALENFEDWVLSSYGTTGIPLAYVIRTHVELPESDTLPNEADPGYGQPDRKAEMIRRAPHVGQTFDTDNATVWACICHIFYDGPAKAWIKSHSRDQDGRAAYFSVKAHYLGTGFQNRVKSTADTVLENTFYRGGSKTFTFEKYSERLASAFTDLEENHETVTTERKIRILLKGIEAPFMEAGKCTVEATERYMQSYDEALNFLASIAAKHEAKTRQVRKMAAVTTGRGGGGRGRGGQSGRGSGRFAGRGRGGGRFGGRGGGGRGGGQKSAFDHNNPGRRYSKEELRTFSNADWKAMYEAREAENKEGADSKRRTAAVQIQQEEAGCDEESAQGVGRSIKRRTGGR